MPCYFCCILTDMLKTKYTIVILALENLLEFNNNKKVYYICPAWVSSFSALHSSVRFPSGVVFFWFFFFTKRLPLTFLLMLTPHGNDSSQLPDVWKSLSFTFVLKDGFTRYRILGWQILLLLFWFFAPSKCCCVVLCLAVSNESSAASHVCCSLCHQSLPLGPRRPCIMDSK